MPFLKADYADDMTLPPKEQRRRRMRAARALAGFSSVKDLAGVIPVEAELGERTLRKYESGESELRPPEMREIAHACGLPYEFFIADFNRLPELADDQPAESPTGVTAQLEAMQMRLAALEEAANLQGDEGRRRKAPPRRRQPS